MDTMFTPALERNFIGVTRLRFRGAHDVKNGLRSVFNNRKHELEYKSYESIFGLSR